MRDSPASTSPAANSSQHATLHHVGFVVASIAASGAAFAASLGMEWNGEIIHDPQQQARVTFLRSHRDHAQAIELVEPDGDQSPLQNFVARGGGLHHVCYEVDCLSAELEERRKAGCLIVKPPLPAVAFEGRLIAWVYSPQKLLVEYLERHHA